MAGLSSSSLVLVTGATGFIGSQLCRAMLAQGVRVRAFHRPNSPQTLIEGLSLEHALGDLTQPDTLQAAMQGVDVVFHTAAQLGLQRGLRGMTAVTIEGTRHVMDAALRSGVRRLVHTSSVAALGVPDATPQDTPLPMNENHTWNYRADWWPYGYAKYRAELEVQKAIAQGLDAVIVNPSVVLGAGDLNRISGAVLIHVAQRHLPIAAPGGLNAVHIDDVVRGHLLAAERGQRGERYILGNENITHLQFLTLCAGLANVPAPRLVLPKWLVQTLAWPLGVLGGWLPLPVRGVDLHRVGYHFYYDNRKACQELGLENLHPVRQAIAEALAWYGQHGMLP